MRFLGRLALPQRASRALEFYQKDLIGALAKTPDADKQGKLITDHWKDRRDSTTLRTIEVALKVMASGLSRCMYCEDSAGSDVEHFRPKVHYPDDTYRWTNLLLICSICNRQKNDDFHESILDPTTHPDILDHLSLSFTNGRLTERNNSERGSITLQRLKRLANDQILTGGRLRVLRNLKRNLKLYDTCHRNGDGAEASRIRADLVAEPFSSVLAYLLYASRCADAEVVLEKDLLDILARNPDIHEWLHDADKGRFDNALAHLESMALEIRVRTGDEGEA